MPTTAVTSNADGCLKKLEESTITEEYRKKAEVELGETEENREKCLVELRILLNGEADLNANDSDNFLLQFLRAKKFRTDEAFLMLKKYYRHRVLYPAFYQKFSPKQNIQALKSNLQNFLPMRTSDNCAIWVSRVGSWRPNDCDVQALFKCGVLCFIKELQNPVTQINGIVSIVDLQGFSRIHLYHLQISFLKLFIALAQDCLPVRHKAIHVINNPAIFGVIFAIIKPFIKDKIRDRIYFHGYDLRSLHEHLPQHLLPEEFGGTRGPFQNEQFYDSMMDSEEFFLEELKHGYEIKPTEIG